jgi:PTH1 family peptidyl-tRNA hydrolase
MSKGVIMGHDVALMKPLTYMNRSGLAVQSFLSYYKEKRQILVIHDDVDLAVGSLRIRYGGSAGGHKGVRSIVESLGSYDFIRVKVGIGRPVHIPVSDYVLNPFSKDERELIQQCLKRAQEAVVAIIDKGLTSAQNIFNKKEVLSNEQKSTNDPSRT